MNEVNSAARPQKKRRSFLWLWILLLLFSFTGGIILGLKLNTLPMPNDVKNRLYPVLEALIPGSTANRPQEAPAATPVPTATPAPTETPAPVVTPSPVELPAVTVPPMETVSPAVSTPVSTDALTGFELPETEDLALEDSARFEAPASESQKYIGIDAALDAALRYAEIEKKDANVTGVYRTKDADGEAVYEVSFTVGELSYEYVLSAVDGEILSWKISGFHMEDTETFGELPQAPAPAETAKHG